LSTHSGMRGDIYLTTVGCMLTGQRTRNSIARKGRVMSNETDVNVNRLS